MHISIFTKSIDESSYDKRTLTITEVWMEYLVDFVQESLHFLLENNNLQLKEHYA